MQTPLVPDAPPMREFVAPRPEAAPADPSRPAPRDLTARILPGVAVLILLLSLVPVADWIPGGFSSDSWALLRVEWVSGTAIVAGVAVVLAILSRRLAPLWRPLAPGTLDRVAERRWNVGVLLVTLAAFALYLLVARDIAGNLSILIDEMAETLQARMFVEGRLWTPVPQPVEFFSTQHMLYHEGRSFSQFPPGGPGAIALGTLVGAEWLVGPVFAVLSVLLWAAWLRRTGEAPATAFAALALFALAPFTMFMAGTRMNHVPATTCILAASVALVTLADDARPRSSGTRLLLGLLCGLGYGLAATIRPVDAAAFALPGAAWLVARAIRDRRHVPELLLSGLGVALPLAFVFWFNLQTTGHPTRFGYQLLWGKAHDLGFHMAPWGIEHTPSRGLELVANYLMSLQRNFLETPAPALLALCGAFLLTRRTSAADRYLLASSLILVAAYWAYWHEGKFMGPRFLYSLLPVLALWTARFPRLLRERLGPSASTDLRWRGAVYAMATALVMAVAYVIPLRWMQYRTTFASFRWSPAEESAKAGVRNALVLVREGWESQLVVRMWQLGISHPRSELYYRAIDACRLEHTLSELERLPVDSTRAIRRLDGMLGDSLGVVTVRSNSGYNVRMQQGLAYPPRCLNRLRDIAAGVIALAPILAAPPDGNVYARDLHARDTLLLARYPGRPIWLLSAADSTPNALPRFYRVDPDSLRRAWAVEAAEDLQRSSSISSAATTGGR